MQLWTRTLLQPVWLRKLISSHEEIRICLVKPLCRGWTCARIKAGALTSILPAVLTSLLRGTGVSEGTAEGSGAFLNLQWEQCLCFGCFYHRSTVWKKSIKKWNCGVNRGCIQCEGEHNGFQYIEAQEPVERLWTSCGKLFLCCLEKTNAEYMLVLELLGLANTFPEKP